MGTRLKAVVLLAALAGPLAVAHPASAAPSGACNLAGNITFNPGLNLGSNSGTQYQVSATVVCTLTGSGGQTGEFGFDSSGTVSGSLLAQISFSGTYTSEPLCGGGTVGGTVSGSAVFATLHATCFDGSSLNCTYRGGWTPSNGFPITSGEVGGWMVCATVT